MSRHLRGRPTAPMRRGLAFKGHAFNPRAEPADYHGRVVCQDCGKLGADGDAQHPSGAAPLHAEDSRAATYRQVEARMLGEAND